MATHSPNSIDETWTGLKPSARITATSLIRSRTIIAVAFAAMSNTVISTIAHRLQTMPRKWQRACVREHLVGVDVGLPPLNRDGALVQRDQSVDELRGSEPLQLAPDGDPGRRGLARQAKREEHPAVPPSRILR